jgi:hypothetical protein
MRREARSIGWPKIPTFIAVPTWSRVSARKRNFLRAIVLTDFPFKSGTVAKKPPPSSTERGSTTIGYSSLLIAAS